MSSGFFPALKAMGGAFTGAVVASCNAIPTTANAVNEAAETVEKGASWLNGQAGKMLAEMAVEVAQESDWPAKTPQDISKALIVLKSMGRTLTEKEAELLSNYNIAKPAQVPPVPPT
jgi:hypothetical protein